MVVSFRVEIRGMKKALKTVSELSKETVKSIDDAIQTSAKLVAQNAKLLAPVKTGRLKESIVSEKIADKVARVRDGVPYGVYQEMGFFHWKSGRFIRNPFLEPSIFAVLSQMEDRITYSIERLVRK